MSGSSIAPLFLRLVLAVTFLWAGFGKVLEKMPVSGARAAALANMGVGDVIKAAGTNASAPAEPAAPKAPPPATKPDQSKPDQTKPDQPKEVSEDVTKSIATSPTAPTGSAANQPASQAANPGRTYTAADFPSEIRIARVYGIALLIDRAAHPPGKESQPQPMSLWPAALATGSLPIYFAWASMVTEVVSGLFVLVGLLTRISALSLAGTMIAAMWLTELGPAIQSGDTFMGLLPAYGAYAMDEAGKFKFMSLLWQFALFGCGMALMFAGPGYLSFDRALFPGKAKDDSI